MDEGNEDAGFLPDISRRTVLRGTAASAGITIASSSGTADHSEDVESRVSGPEFEEREWGYVRTDFEPPEAGSDTPVVLSMEGYGRWYISGPAEQTPPTHYVRMRDGVYIALQMDDHGLVRGEDLVGDYQTVYGSIRGTGCSGGQFDLFDRTHARDGREVIEWIADRPWSLDRVGLLGGSYSGLTSFLIASTQPPSLAAMSASMVTGDLYRGIAYPGGVPNSGFPGLWAGGVRPGLDTAGTATGTAQSDPICAQNTADREPTHPEDQGTLGLYSRRRDGLTYHARELLTYADDIEIPTYIGQAWQDEQTGPRGGPMMFNAISPDPASPPGTPGADGNRPARHEEPKLLRATNGFHNDAGAMAADDVRAWFDYWLLGKETDIMDKPPVKLVVNNGTDDKGSVGLADFPSPSTDWTRYYFGEGGTLVPTPPESGGTDSYVTGSPRQSWLWGNKQADPVNEAGSPVTQADGPDVLTYRSSAFDSPQILAGPLAARLFVETTTEDMDLFVSILDQYPDGNAIPIQRGLLRASHRSLETRSEYTDDGELARPHHPHTHPQSVTPGQIARYDIEVFPIGHVLYPGHRLVVRVHSPPATDGLWAYEPLDQTGQNTLYRDPDHPSSILVPLIDARDRDLPPEPACGEPWGHRCVQL